MNTTHSPPKHLITIVVIADLGVSSLSVLSRVALFNMFSIRDGAFSSNLQDIFPITIRSLRLKYKAIN
jgi:hypothetical protein